MLCIALFALAGLGGCGGDQPEGRAGLMRLAAADGPPEVRELKIGALPIGDLKQLYVADAKGFFRDEGLEVEIQDFEGGATIIPAVESGSVDVGFSNSVSILQARARGLAMRFFAGGVNQGPGHWTAAIMVRDDSSIREPAQLRGRSVAMNTLANINELVIRAYLKHAGVQPDDYQLLEIPFPDQPAALESGRVDAIVPQEPFMTLAEQDGARVVDARPFAAIGPDPFVAAFFAKDDWLRANPNTAAAFRRAIDRATAYWLAHPEERAAIVARYTEVPAAIAGRMAFALPRTEISASDLQQQIELARRYELIPKVFDAHEVLAR